MNQLGTEHDGSATDPMARDPKAHTDTDANALERLSALADGQLEGEELAAALTFALQDAQGPAAWQLYHLVGDVLRSPDLARPADPAFMARLRERLARETPPVPLPPLAPPVQPRTLVSLDVLAPAQEPAANASVFRWKILTSLACFVCFATLGAMVWTSLAPWQGGPGVGDAQLATAPGQSAVQQAPAVTVADAEGSQQPMVRDQRLDELLAAHQQLGSMSTLPMPTGFLRNATFDPSGR